MKSGQKVLSGLVKYISVDQKEPFIDIYLTIDIKPHFGMGLFFGTEEVIHIKFLNGTLSQYNTVYL